MSEPYIFIYAYLDRYYQRGIASSIKHPASSIKHLSIITNQPSKPSKMSVLSVSISDTHSFGKTPTDYIYLLRQHGVQGDAHCSPRPSSSNLRQVHLVASELFSDLAAPSSRYPSFQLSPGSLGENITTQGVDLVRLGEGTRLHFGDHEGHAVVRITGLRDPRKRLGEWPQGLLERCSLKDKKGKVVGKKVGVMGVVEEEGYVKPGYVIYVEPPKTFKMLGNV